MLENLGSADLQIVADGLHGTELVAGLFRGSGKMYLRRNNDLGDTKDLIDCVHISLRTTDPDSRLECTEYFVKLLYSN